MITYTFYAGTYDDLVEDRASVELVYWTKDEPDFFEIDEQIKAQFLGLA